MSEQMKRIKMFIIQYKIEHGGNSPSTREIMSAVGYQTTSAVNHQLNMMYERGDLIPGPKREARMIQVPGLQVTWVG